MVALSVLLTLNVLCRAALVEAPVAPPLVSPIPALAPALPALPTLPQAVVSLPSLPNLSTPLSYQPVLKLVDKLERAETDDLAAPGIAVQNRSGTLLHVDAFSSKLLSNTRPLTLYLPPGYGSDPAKRYAVLYAQDGQNLFEDATAYNGKSWGLKETLDRLIAAGEMEPVIVVGVWNTPARIAEYTPTPDPNHPEGGWAELYGRFLIEELKPVVDARLRSDAARSALLGSSLGGLVSLHLALTRPDIFSRAAGLSASLWWDDGQLLRSLAAAKRLPGASRPRLWIDMGTAEGPDPSDQKANVERLRELSALLQARRWTPGADLEARVIPGATHDELAWRARAADVLRFLFPAR